GRGCNACPRRHARRRAGCGARPAVRLGRRCAVRMPGGGARRRDLDARGAGTRHAITAPRGSAAQPRLDLHRLRRRAVFHRACGAADHRSVAGPAGARAAYPRRLRAPVARAPRSGRDDHRDARPRLRRRLQHPHQQRAGATRRRERLVPRSRSRSAGAHPHTRSRARPAHALARVAIFFVMRALGELLTYRPVAGSFATYAGEFCGPFAGFVTGWSYWFMWVVMAMAELTAIGIYVRYWFPNVPQWLPP